MLSQDAHINVCSGHLNATFGGKDMVSMAQTGLLWVPSDALGHTWALPGALQQQSVRAMQRSGARRRRLPLARGVCARLYPLWAQAAGRRPSASPRADRSPAHRRRRACPFVRTHAAASAASACTCGTHTDA